MAGSGFISELKWRGLLHQTSATEAAVEAHLSGYRASELALELRARAEGVDRLGVGARW